MSEQLAMTNLQNLASRCVLEMANASTPSDVLAHYFQQAFQLGWTEGWDSRDDGDPKTYPFDGEQGYGAGV